VLRVDCIKAIGDIVSGALVITTAGGATHEWWAFGDNRGQLQVRTLGLGSSIGLGLAVSRPSRQVIVLDGDGGLLMNLYTFVTCAAKSPPNLLHICFDNGVYESSGGTPTFTGVAGTDLGAIARAAGVGHVEQPTSVAEFVSAVRTALTDRVHTFIHARVEPGRPNVPNIAHDEVENKYRFARYVEETEGITILTGPRAPRPPAQR
jgi:thiamine pyrophosphate-dependent acetolactate synthase large subunit-like protein